MALETLVRQDVHRLIDGLNFAEKVDRALWLLSEAHQRYGDRLVVAHSLGKDSCVVWDLAKQVSPAIRGFIVATRFYPIETRRFMNELLARHPELKVYQNDEPMPEGLHATDPGRCCETLKVQTTRRAIEEMGADCWVTGLRGAVGGTWIGFKEVEQRDQGLVKLNPILVWHEREVWQYLCLHGVAVNPLYAEGYRSLGCAPCSRIIRGRDQDGGRSLGDGKYRGECGIHSQPLGISPRG
jgi:phosphoadenosine phosphosulfate reductase